MIAESILRLPRLDWDQRGGRDGARLIAWRKRPGQEFRRGETLALLEAGGEPIELPALAAGRLIEALVAPGERLLASGTPLARIAGAKPAGASGAALMGRLGEPETLRIAAGDGWISIRRWPAKGQRRILLLHGFGGDKTGWAAVAVKLWRRGITVLAADLPGHGESEGGDSTPAGMAVRLALALEDPALGLAGQVIELAGHSLGAAVAVELASLAPERIGALSLVAPLGFGRTADQEFVDGLVGAADRPTLERLLARASLRPLVFPDAAWRHMLEGLARTGRAAERAAIAAATVRGGRQRIDLGGPIAELAIPVRVMLGRHDRIASSEAALELPAWTALHFFGAGHLLQWEEPEAVADLLGEQRCRLR